jgi:hypothetical protein
MVGKISRLKLRSELCSSRRKSVLEKKVFVILPLYLKQMISKLPTQRDEAAERSKSAAADNLELSTNSFQLSACI